MRRITEKFDGYMAAKDFGGAERHLLYWLAEAGQACDLRGQFSLQNELMGFYRKTGEKEKALSAARSALGLAEKIGMHGESLATCYINAATVYDAFEMPSSSVPLFENAKKIYEAELCEGDLRLSALYNNYALAMVALKRYGESYELFQKALGVLQRAEGGQLEKAMTYLNMADAVYAEHGIEKAEAKIAQYIELAEKLLDDPAVPHNAYYAFVCEKCAPGFGFYGYFSAEEKYKKVSKEIYERS